MRFFFLIFVSLLTGCATEPVPYHSGNEIPRGPGLLSGEQGEFVLRAGSSAAPRDATEEKDYQQWREERKRRQETPAK